MNFNKSQILKINLTILIAYSLGFSNIQLYAASKSRSSLSDEANEETALLSSNTNYSSCTPPLTSPIDRRSLQSMDDIAQEYNDSLPEPDKWKDYTSVNCVKNKKYKLNFGVVIYNDYYKLYRSTGLNEEGLKVYGRHIRDAGLELPQRIMYLHHNNYEKSPGFKARLKAWGLRAQKKLYGGNFAYHESRLSQEVQPETCPGLNPSPAGSSSSLSSNYCYRGKYKGYFPFKFYHPLAKDEGAQVDYLEAKCNPLSRTTNPCLTCNGKPNCKNLANITPEQGTASLRKLMKQLLVSDDPTGFHCQGGLHRTGAAALLLRYLQGGAWTDPFKSPPTVQTSMKVSTDGKEKKISLTSELKNLAEKEYYDHNSKDFRSANLEMMRDFSKDPLFVCVKEKFGPYLNARPTNPPQSIANCYPFTPPTKEGILPPQQFDLSKRNEFFQQCLKETGVNIPSISEDSSGNRKD